MEVFDVGKLTARVGMFLYKTSLAYLAINSSYSTEFARLFLDFGAEIDDALLSAIPDCTNRHIAQYIKFLLKNGAGHTIKNRRGRTAGDYSAAKGIQKWLDMTWDELVESTCEAREERKRRKAPHINTVNPAPQQVSRGNSDADEPYPVTPTTPEYDIGWTDT